MTDNTAPEPDFSWSLHKAALADLQAENKELRDALHEIASTICDCREGPDCPAHELVETAHQALKGAGQ